MVHCACVRCKGFNAVSFLNILVVNNQTENTKGIQKNFPYLTYNIQWKFSLVQWTASLGFWEQVKRLFKTFHPSINFYPSMNINTDLTDMRAQKIGKGVPG